MGGLSYHVFVGPDFESKLFRSHEQGVEHCELFTGWSYVGEMEEIVYE